MNKITNLIMFITLVLPQLLMAGNPSQHMKSSVEWVSGLTWQQIKEKAKVENKYVFIDAFATWCVPCKKMDKETFPNTEVVELLNAQFISVKVQMDKTKKDDDVIKGWYEDAGVIKNTYRIRSYPTYIFLSPSGEIVHLITGFKKAEKFVEEVNIALLPGQQYKDPNEEYYILLEKYERNKSNYSDLPFLFKKAKELGEGDVARSISKDYREYLKVQKIKKWYTKENIDFLAEHTLTSKSPFYTMWSKRGKKVDKIMGMNGYSRSIMDRIIQREIAEPFLGLKREGTFGMLGGRKDTTEADWIGLHDLISKKYGQAFAKRNTMDARLNWYGIHFNTPKLVEYLFLALDQYGFELINNDNKRSLREVNHLFWGVFLSSTDLATLTAAANWMREVVRRSEKDNLHCQFIDTYANLLYKTGNVNSAIEWEEKAVKLASANGLESSSARQFREVLSKMKAGLATWPLSKEM